jgi:hypothetical protein
MMDRTARLARSLTDAAGLLRAHQVHHWPEQLEKYATRIQSNDPGAASQLLDEFGGMGSLNDVWIDPRNGNLIAPDQIQAVNARLRQLLSQIYELAKP